MAETTEKSNERMKWTPERLAKFRKTMRLKAKAKLIEEKAKLAVKKSNGATSHSNIARA